MMTEGSALHLDDHDLAVLQVANLMGAATRTQIQTYLSHPRRVSALRSDENCPPWKTHVTRNRVDQAVRRNLLEVLPFRGAYYAGQSAIRQAVIRLTKAGAEALQAADIPASARSFHERATLRHALAIVDVRAALLALPDVAAVETDRLLCGDDRGQGGLRPDNRVRWADPVRPWVLFESELEAERGSETRLRKKLARLARFFLSDQSHNCDPAVRIIYLWKPLGDSDPDSRDQRRLRQHQLAMTVWANACYTVRIQMPDRTLPFQLYFISHRDFLARPDTPLSDYELLSATGVLELPSPRPSQAVPGVAVDTPSADDLDAEALSWIVGFHRTTRHGFPTKSDVRTACAAVSAFLDRRPALRMALQRTISQVASAANNEQKRQDLELVGESLLNDLGISTGVPDCTDHLEDEFPIIPIGLMTPGENPALIFKINPSMADNILKDCPNTPPDDLAKALARFVRFLVRKRRELDLIASKRVAGRRDL